MKKVLTQKFFNRPTLEVTADLLGKFLIRKRADQEIALIINEVEAYDGPADLACHASKGYTVRTAPLFGEAGHFYIYLCYGLHWMLNIVVGPQNYPAAILIRGAGAIRGPARLTKFLHIDKNFNEKKAEPKTGLWFEDRGVLLNKKIVQKTPRIGINSAGAIWSQKPYRFLFNADDYSSKS